MEERLATTFLGRDLITPLVLPAGVVGMSFSSLQRAIDCGAGMVTTKSFTLAPRAGHPGPVVAEFQGGLMNCMGLCNPGIAEGLLEIAEFRNICNAPIIVSVFGTSADEFEELSRTLRGSGADFVELNLSCPNVSEEHGAPLASSPEAVRTMVSAAKRVSDVPVIAKLSPNVTDIGEIATAASKGGADALTLINTVGPGMAIDVTTARPVLSNVVGGMSGPAIKPIAVRAIYEAHNAVDLPIIGMGGVATGEDAIELLLAGANLVGIGTAVCERGTEVFRNVGSEIVDYLDRTKQNSVNDLASILEANRCR